MLLAAAIALPVIGVTLVVKALARRMFPDSPRVQEAIERYGLWATIPIAVVVLTFTSAPLGIGFAAVVAVLAVFGRRIGLPFGFRFSASSRRGR